MTCDRKYIGNEMKLRIDDARKDWEEVRDSFRKIKNKLLRETKDVKQQNELRRELGRLKASNEREFLERKTKTL